MISIAIVYVGLAVLAPLCALAQRLRPAAQGVPRVWSRARAIDWAYWVLTPLGAGVLSRAMVIGAGAALALALGASVRDADDVLRFFAERSFFGGPSLLARLPWLAQLVLCLLLVDLLSYWSHRLRHHPVFFPIHATHHSARELDWLAAARMHPLDEIVDNVAVTLPVLALGPDPLVLLALGPITLLYTLFSHSAVALSLGPLRHVLVSPEFHRRHHAIEVPSANYAGMFAFWDRLFGTFTEPAMSSPAQRFGLGEAPLADTWRDQLLEPVRRLLRGA